MSNKSKLQQLLNLRTEWNAEIAANNVTNPNTSPHATQNALAAASGGQTSAQLAESANAAARRVAKPRGACKGLRCTVQGGKRRHRRSAKRRRVKH